MCLNFHLPNTLQGDMPYALLSALVLGLDDPWPARFDLQLGGIKHRQFGSGCDLLTKDMNARMEKLTGRVHPVIRRQLHFAHSDFDKILDWHQAGKAWYLYTGRGSHDPLQITDDDIITSLEQAKLTKTLACENIKDSCNVARIACPTVQAVPAFTSTFPVPFGGRSEMMCLIRAIDQDPYFRMSPAASPLPQIMHAQEQLEQQEQELEAQQLQFSCKYQEILRDNAVAVGNQNASLASLDDDDEDPDEEDIYGQFGGAEDGGAGSLALSKHASPDDDSYLDLSDTMKISKEQIAELRQRLGKGGQGGLSRHNPLRQLPPHRKNESFNVIERGQSDEVGADGVRVVGADGVESKKAHRRTETTVVATLSLHDAEEEEDTGEEEEVEVQAEEKGQEMAQAKDSEKAEAKGDAKGKHVGQAQGQAGEDDRARHARQSQGQGQAGEDGPALLDSSCWFASVCTCVCFLCMYYASLDAVRIASLPNLGKFAKTQTGLRRHDDTTTTRPNTTLFFFSRFCWKGGLRPQ